MGDADTNHFWLKNREDPNADLQAVLEAGNVLFHTKSEPTVK